MTIGRVRVGEWFTTTVKAESVKEKGVGDGS